MPDPPLDLVIKNVRVVRPRRPQVERLDLGVQDGRFARIAPDIPAAEARAVYDARARLGFPGVVDAHTHVGIYGPLAGDAVSESRAAVSGGVTTMLTYFRTGQYYLNRGDAYAEFFPEVLEQVSPGADRRLPRRRDGAAGHPARRAVLQGLHVLLTTRRGSPGGHETAISEGNTIRPCLASSPQCCEVNRTGFPGELVT